MILNISIPISRHGVFTHLDVGGVPLAVVPGGLDGVEEPVGVVELARLEGEELRGEGLQPQQVVQHEGRRRVVRAVVERRNLHKAKSGLHTKNSLGLLKKKPLKIAFGDNFGDRFRDKFFPSESGSWPACSLFGQTVIQTLFLHFANQHHCESVGQGR